MGERAQKVLIENGEVTLFYSQWGGQSCYQCLLAGEQGLLRDLQVSRHDEWVIPEFAEGGYLVDRDTSTILLYSWDARSIHADLPQIQALWPGWTVRAVEHGVPDFQAYVEGRNL